MDQALIEESAALPLAAQAQEHVRSCERCQALVSALNVPAPSEPPSAAALHRIEQAIIADLRPVRPLAPARYAVAALVSIFVSIVAFCGYGLGAFSLDVMSPLQTGVIFSILAASLGLLAYSLARQIIPGSRHRIPPRQLPVAIVTALVVTVAVLFQFEHEGDFWANGWVCLRTGIPIGVLSALPFWLVLRRGAILSPGSTGAATGLLAGLAGASVLEIHCPNLDARHILVSHLGVAVVCSLGGLVTGLAAAIIGEHWARVRRALH